jgi:hypothetical protein
MAAFKRAPAVAARLLTQGCIKSIHDVPPSLNLALR